MTERALNWIGYQLMMWGYWRVTCNPNTRFGGWCLQRAGAHAYGEQLSGSEK